MLRNRKGAEARDLKAFHFHWHMVRSWESNSRRMSDVEDWWGRDECGGQVQETLQAAESDQMNKAKPSGSKRQRLKGRRCDGGVSATFHFRVGFWAFDRFRFGPSSLQRLCKNGVKTNSQAKMHMWVLSGSSLSDLKMFLCKSTPSIKSGKGKEPEKMQRTDCGHIIQRPVTTGIVYDSLTDCYQPTISYLLQSGFWRNVTVGYPVCQQSKPLPPPFQNNPLNGFTCY